MDYSWAKIGLRMTPESSKHWPRDESKSQKYQVRAEPQITKRSVPLRPARRDTQNGLLMGEKRTPDDPRKLKTPNQHMLKAIRTDPAYIQDRSRQDTDAEAESCVDRSPLTAGPVLQRPVLLQRGADFARLQTWGASQGLF